MMMTRRHMIALSAAMLTPAQAAAVPLVFAAASLKNVLDEISRDIPMRLNYAGSGVLARQISYGAPADLFISANPIWTQTLFDAGKLAAPATPLMGNRLVLIGPVGSANTDPQSLQGKGRIAMGLTEAVPAGQYGKAAFQSLGIWDAIEGQVVQTENVRAAMALVSRGEVPWGVVYKTDAAADPSVDVVAEFADGSYPKIIYDAGVVKGSDTAILSSMMSSKALDTFVRHGFVPL